MLLVLQSADPLLLRLEGSVLFRLPVPACAPALTGWPVLLMLSGGCVNAVLACHRLSTASTPSAIVDLPGPAVDAAVAACGADDDYRAHY